MAHLAARRTNLVIFLFRRFSLRAKDRYIGPEIRPLRTITAREYPPTTHCPGHSPTREQAMVELKAQWLSTVTVHSHIVTTHSQIKLSDTPFIVARVNARHELPD